MKNRWVTTLLAGVIIMVVAGCMGQTNSAEQLLQHVPATNFANEDTAIEEIDTESIDNNGEDANVNEGKTSIESESEASETQKLSIVVGDAVKLQTSLEHVPVTSDGTEYTIEPYGVTFALTTAMGEPAVKDERVVFSQDLSVDLSVVATISYEVMDNMSLNEAAAKEQQDYKGVFSGEFIETISNDGLKGIHNQYKDDSVFSGVFFYEFDKHVLRIEYRCPLEGVDSMLRIVNETVDSVKMNR